jgi:signal transduction histidine kinase
VFGFSIVLFFILFGTHAFLVDTGRLNSPYLSSYGFLVVAIVMSYDLAGEVVRASQLSAELSRKEADLLKAVTDERSRIASDLHDSVTQTLFSTAAIADALPDVWDRYPEEARRGLVELRQLTKGALAEMRSLLLELRPTALLDKDLGELLTQLADGTVARTRMPVAATIDCDRQVPEDVHVAMYRVAQEALNNVVKHAQATKATLSLTGDSDGIIVVVRDDGKGFNPQVAEEGRLGLEIMRERVRSIGATINIDSQHGQGTTIEVVWKDMPPGDSDG